MQKQIIGHIIYTAAEVCILNKIQQKVNEIGSITGLCPIKGVERTCIIMISIYEALQ